ncbi:MAG: dockerin type I domain-containing protein [Candidatus Hydrogenedentota bacterium]
MHLPSKNTSTQLIQRTFAFLAMAALTLTAPAAWTNDADGGSALVTIVADNAADSNNDGLPDVVKTALGADPHAEDSNGDGIPDAWKIHYGLDVLSSENAEWDMDGGGLTNYEEYLYGTNPYRRDTDGDGFWDSFEVLERGTDPADNSSYPTSDIPADVNCDETVDARDVQLVINGVLGMDVPVPVDVTGSGSANAMDIQKAINALLGL